jgi:CUB/sushi domain-containing protein
MPDIIEHGYIGFEVGGSATSLGTGSVILYDCEEGYKLVGARERSCLPSGDWTDQEPSCHQIFCERLPSTMEHGTVTGAEENIYGSVVQFFCDPGYELDGPERLSCEDDENWSGIMPTCRPVECPNPGLVANIVVSLKQADVRLDPEVYHYGDVLVYTCRRGYGIVKSDNDSGVVERRCLADGSWSSKPPVCSRVSCPPAVIPQNGYTSRPVQNEVANVNETEEAAMVGQIIHYGCKKGYQLTDYSPKMAKCLETGKWRRADSVPSTARRQERQTGRKREKGIFKFGFRQIRMPFRRHTGRRNHHAHLSAVGWTEDGPTVPNGIEILLSRRIRFGGQRVD